MNLENYLTILLYASYYSPLLPILIYLLRFNKVRGNPFHIIGSLVIISGLSDLVGYILLNNNLGNAIVYNIYTLFEFILLSFYFYSTLFNRNYKYALLIALLNFIIAFAIFQFFAQDLFVNQNLIWFTTSVLFLVYGLFHLKQLLNDKSGIIGQTGIYWISVGVILYTSLSLVPFAFTDAMLTSLPSEISRFIWSFAQLGNICRNILFAFGIYYSTRENW
jgi:hypothetical protein